MPSPGFPARRLAALFVLGTLSGSCAGFGGTHAIHAWTMRDRVASVAAGNTLEQAHARLGNDPVRRPGHPDDPFESPRAVLVLATPAGQAVRVELYVIATQPAEGCPDVHYEDEPIAFVDGVVAGKGWAWVERRWREWGGSLQILRDAQDHHRCPYPRPS